jgi:glycosyltransferase involved in cell wall biosynthesis
VKDPRLLVLSAFPPSSAAPHGGSRVSAELVSRLAAEWRVALVYPRAPDEPSVDEALRTRCEHVIEVPRPRPKPGRARSRLRRLAALARGRPSWVAEWASPELEASLHRLLERWQPDLVHVHFQVMGQYLAELDRRAPRVLVVHEPAASRAAAAVSQATSLPARLYRHLDYRAWLRFERRLLNDVDAAVVFTDADRDELARLGSTTPISVIPFAVAPPGHSGTIEAPPRDGPVLFVGNFDHGPNADAAVRLARAIFPRVVELAPEATLEIVGPNPPPELHASAGPVVVTGYVADVEAHVRRAAVFAAPIRLGGGMRLKVLEALAAGKAIVASPLAARGTGARDGEELLLADTDEAFATAIAELLRDPERRRALELRAHAFAAEALGWEHVVDAYRHLHASLGSRQSTASPERDHQRVARERPEPGAPETPPPVAPTDQGASESD